MTEAVQEYDNDTHLSPALFQDEADRREEARVPYEHPVQVGSPFETPYATVWAENLSPGGIFIVSDRSAKIGARFSLRLQLPDGEYVYIPDAEILYNRGGNDTVVSGFGARFVALSEDVRERLVGAAKFGTQIFGPAEKEDAGTQDQLPLRAEADAVVESLLEPKEASADVPEVATSVPQLPSMPPALPSLPSESPTAMGPAAAPQTVAVPEPAEVAIPELAEGEDIAATGDSETTAEYLPPFPRTSDLRLSTRGPAAAEVAETERLSLGDIDVVGAPASNSGRHQDAARSRNRLVWVGAVIGVLLGFVLMFSFSGGDAGVSPENRVAAESPAPTSPAMPGDTRSALVHETQPLAGVGPEPGSGAAEAKTAKAQAAETPAAKAGAAKAVTPLPPLVELRSAKLRGGVAIGIGEAPVLRTSRLTQPPRFVIDLAGDVPVQLPAASGRVLGIRLGKHPSFTRVVLDLDGPFKAGRLDRQGETLVVVIE